MIELLRFIFHGSSNRIGKIISLLAALFLITAVSCQRQQVKVQEGMFTKAEYDNIEQRTTRKIIRVDTAALDSVSKERLRLFMESERICLKNGLKLALGYEMGDGFEVIHFKYDRHYCHMDCPDLYVQLTNAEYENLMNYVLNNFPSGESKDDVKDDEGRTYHRRIGITACGVELLLEADYNDRKREVWLITENETRALTYHSHAHFLCQTHAPNYYYRLWKSQQKSKKAH